MRSFATADRFEDALLEGLGPAYRSGLPDESAGLPAGRRAPQPRDLARPFAFDSEAVECIQHLPYGPGGRRNTLDVYRPRGEVAGAPILLQIHGGAWTIGSKEQQGRPLMKYLAERGWGLLRDQLPGSGSKFRFPDFLIDCKRALAWIREHAHEYGGDPGFVAVTGGSAGGHLSSLVALTSGDARFQPGFEDADTSIQAAVPFYGIYDFLDRKNVRGRSSMKPFLERVAMPCGPEADPELWESASPISHVSPDSTALLRHPRHARLVGLRRGRAALRRAAAERLAQPGGLRGAARL